MPRKEADLGGPSRAPVTLKEVSSLCGSQVIMAKKSKEVRYLKIEMVICIGLPAQFIHN